MRAFSPAAFVLTGVLHSRFSGAFHVSCLTASTRPLRHFFHRHLDTHDTDLTLVLNHPHWIHVYSRLTVEEGKHQSQGESPSLLCKRRDIKISWRYFVPPTNCRCPSSPPIAPLVPVQTIFVSTWRFAHSGGPKLVVRYSSPLDPIPLTVQESSISLHVCASPGGTEPFCWKFGRFLRFYGVQHRNQVQPMKNLVQTSILTEPGAEGACNRQLLRLNVPSLAILCINVNV